MGIERRRRGKIWGGSRREAGDGAGREGKK